MTPTVFKPPREIGCEEEDYVGAGEGTHLIFISILTLGAQFQIEGEGREND